MRFPYYIPHVESDDPYVNEKFLPSLAFTVFSRNGTDSLHRRLQGIYSRRIPHVMQLKFRMLNRFKTSLIVPIGKDKDPSYYIDFESDSFWSNPSLLSRYEKFDYLVGGSVTLDGELMKVQVYSRIDDKIIYEREYRGEIDQIFDNIKDFVKDLLIFFEILPEEEDLEIIESRPVSKPETLSLFMEALDTDPSNGVKTGNDEIYKELLKEAYLIEPESGDIKDLLLIYAEKILNADKQSQAMEIADFIISVKPEDISAVFLKALILTTEKKMEEAVNVVRDHIGKYRNFELPLRLGRQLMEMNENTIALEIFKAASEAGCSDITLYESYAFLLIYSKEYDEALKILEEGLEKDPEREYLLTLYAQVLAEKEEHEKSLEIYKKALQLYPDSARLLTSRAVALVNQKEEEKALAFIWNALEISPEDPEINLDAARIFNEIGDRENAALYSRTAVDLNPDSRASDEARDFLSRISAGITPEEQNQNRSLFIKAVRSLEKEEFDESLKYIDEILEKEPLFQDAWFLKGLLFRRLGKFQEALDSLMKVDDLYADQISLHHEIARCYMGLEDFRKAFYYILYAFRKRPEDPVIMANMGLVYMFLGRIDEAEILLNHVKKTAPQEMNVEPYLKEIEEIKKRKKLAGGNGGGKPENGKNKNEDPGSESDEEGDEPDSFGINEN